MTKPKRAERPQRPPHARPVEPAALSVTQAAQYLGISRSSMYRLCAESNANGTGLDVVAVLPGRRVFQRAELDRYLAAHIVRGGRRATP